MKKRILLDHKNPGRGERWFESLASIARMLDPNAPADNQAAILGIEWHQLAPTPLSVPA